MKNLQSNCRYIAWLALCVGGFLSYQVSASEFTPYGPGFPSWVKWQIKVADQQLNVLLPVKAKHFQQGLMHAPKLASDQGMLFAWPEIKINCMWMKNTPEDLQVIFFDEYGRYLNHENMLAFDTQSRHCSDFPAKYALEVHAHWLESKKLLDKKGKAVSSVRLTRAPGL